jgi:DNA polymerase-1
MIDRPRVAQSLEYEINEVRGAAQRFLQSTGEVFTDSNMALARVFDKMGEKYPRTAKGNPSFKAEFLEELDTPVAQLINKIRYHERRAGTYYSSFLFFADKHDVIHAEARQAGTETGRMSYRDPNLQNVPKEDEPEDQAIPYHVRESFIPRKDHFFVSIDFEQMEYKVMIDYAGEQKIIKQILEGADFHQAIADQCGITRKQAKTLNFAILYGAGIEKIAKMLGVTLAEARDLKATYFGRLPRVQQLVRHITRAGEARGFVFNWLGRRCHIAQRDWAYVLPNHLIQGGCADIVKIAMNKVDDFQDSRESTTAMLLQVHDELLIETRLGDEGSIPQIRELMTSVYKPQNGMRLTTSVDHSLKSWGYRDKVKGLP